MKLLEAYGLPAIHPRLARDGEEAVLIARQVGYPVVLKVRSPQVIHKTDVGGVQLNLSSDEAVKRGVEKILLEVRRSLPEARVEGVTVQKMIEKPGLEVILGSKKDPTFGAVILFGMGGVAAEIFQDRAVALPPLNERLAQRLVESIRGYKLLQGFRGHPPVNLDLLKEILIRFSYLIVDHPEILEMDINPLRIGQEGAWALDARVRLDREAMTRDLPPYDHLAIRPYPEEYVRQEKMKDGTPLLLRPIRPEDVHLWQELVSGFSPETMRLRFFIAGQKITREMAVRFCFIDYEREIAIVAQIDQKGAQPFVGVGRVATLPDRVTANFAVAVGDRWQGQGVGSLLMDECLRIARERGIHRMTGETLPENRTVIGMLQRRGFKLAAREGIVEASLSWNEPPPAGHS
jgi:acetyltransferase